jgi:hypothetical protein
VVDVFEEVEGELRSERYKQVALKLAPWIVGGLLAGIIVVGGVYAYVTLGEKAVEKASAAYAQGMATLATGDGATAFKKFAEVPASAKGYRSMALMQQGGIRLIDGKKKEAVALFDQAAAAAPGGKLGVLLADVARLKSAFAVMDDASYADTEARLKPLTEENRPYRAEAIEALSLAKINAGKMKEARQDLVLLSLSNDAPEPVRGRARNIVTMIDSGLLANMPAVVKAAAALPPMSNLPPELLQSLQGGPQGPGGPEGPAGAPAPGAPQ